MYLFEGEGDCLLACQLGLPAITITSGADTWMPEFNEQLRDKDIIICYDVDTAGRNGAAMNAMKLLKTARSVSIMTLPLAGTKEEKDFTDFIHVLGHTRAEFESYAAKAQKVEMQSVTAEPGPEVLEIHLAQIGMKEFVGKRVRSTVLVAGKDLAPYQVPLRTQYTCQAVGSEGKQCERCVLGMNLGRKELVLQNWSPELLEFVNIPKERLNAIMCRLVGIPDRCPKPIAKVEEFVNVEVIKVIPEIDFTAENAEYVIRNMFFLGHGIKTNRTYRIEGIVMPEPKTQYATALVYSAEPAQDSIEKFDAMTEMGELKLFQVEEHNESQT